MYIVDKSDISRGKRLSLIALNDQSSGQEKYLTPVSGSLFPYLFPFSKYLTISYFGQVLIID